ncbi:GNAT family N-acetyltransferase [Halorussus sp. JP-T4]|nr:GNAT family N-acetyltransferase [Halorussus sp. JP-T4]NHN57900.1 GNAT family N-acetyltransferase [Halorussus sp. JP-T4]
MPETAVEELTTEAEWTAALPILRQLWTDADESFVRSWADEDDYRLFGLFVGTDDPDTSSVVGEPRESDGELVAVAGVSVQRVLHHARHAWIHDFVVAEAHRGQGYGADLLGFVESWAEDRDCEYVALAVRNGNDDALGFYEAEGMERWGSVVETEL